MNDVFALPDAESLSDLTVFLSRARHLGESAVRLTAAGGVLAVSAAVLHPRGLLDVSPTILGLRTFAESDQAAFDRVVDPAAVLERLARAESAGAPYVLGLPPADVRAVWAGVAPPKGGWVLEGYVDSGVLQRAARSGAAEISAALPESAGDHVVQRVRSQVWARPIEEAPLVEAGVGFAADSLGFLADAESIPFFQSGQWLRLSSRRGHILVRRHGAPAL